MTRGGVVLFGDGDVEVKKNDYCGGNPRNGVKSTVMWRGKAITKAKQYCEKCEGTIDLNYIITMEGGVALARVVNSMEKLGELRKLGYELAEKMDKLDLFSFMVELELLSHKYDAIGLDLYSTHFVNLPVVCPHCHIPHGLITVKLDLVIPEFIPRERTVEQLFESAKHVPKRIQAKITADFGYPDFESLIEWSAGRDGDRLVELVESMRTELSVLHVPEEIVYDFQKYLVKFSMELPRELRALKQRIIDKVIELAKAEASGRR